MTLERFLGARLVVQPPETRIYDAVRALEDHGIGTVLVHDGKALVGIVTARDLALKVLGDDLDAFEFQLGDVMSAPVVAVGPDAALTEVTDLMVREHVRRVPIVDGSAVLGLVSMDDLLLERALDAATVAAIVRSQLGQPSRLEPSGRLREPARATERTQAAWRRASRRRETHRRQAYARLLRRTLALTGVSSLERAEVALDVVLGGLLRRVIPEEAAHVLAQLPSQLRESALAQLPRSPDLSVTRASLERELGRRLDVNEARAQELLLEVGGALRESIGQGELEDFRSQLPLELKELLTNRPLATRLAPV